jgi:hypothetical protein
MAQHKPDPMVVLANMSERHILQTSELINAVIATLLIRFGETSVEFTQDDIAAALESHAIFQTQEPQGLWRVRIVAKDDPAQPPLPHVSMDLEAEKAKYAPPPPVVTFDCAAAMGGRVCDHSGGTFFSEAAQTHVCTDCGAEIALLST